MIEFLVPLGADPLAYRNRAQARATELGWIEPHSGGTSFAHGDHLRRPLKLALQPGMVAKRPTRMMQLEPGARLWRGQRLMATILGAASQDGLLPGR